MTFKWTKPEAAAGAAPLTGYSVSATLICTGTNAPIDGCPVEQVRSHEPTLLHHCCTWHLYLSMQYTDCPWKLCISLTHSQRHPGNCSQQPHANASFCCLAAWRPKDHQFCDRADSIPEGGP